MLHLYKCPDTYIAGVVGEFGSGKSLFLVRNGLDCADFFHKKICTNIDLNEKECREYCRKYGLNWFASCGRIKIIKNPLELLSQEDSIILFDELAIDMFSRGFAEKSRKALIDRIVRPRHYGNFIIYGAQGKEQIDLQMRERTQVYVWCKGFAPYDIYKRRSNLIYRQIFFFKKAAFELFNDEFGQSKWIYPYWASGFRFELGLIGKREKDLFKCYNSFDKRNLEKGREMKYVDGNSIDYAVSDYALSRKFDISGFLSASKRN